MRALSAVLCFVVLPTLPFPPAFAEGTDAAPTTIPAPTVPAPTDPASTPVPAPTKAPSVQCPMCPTCATCPARSDSPTPVYVADWARLFLLTEEDDKVAKLVSEHSQTANQSAIVAEAGIALGSGLALLGVGEWLADDTWSRRNTATVAGGLALAALSGLVSWTLSPNRDDFYTAINLWNRRHPDRRLSP